MDTNSPEMVRYRLEQRAKSGANWFYWIAGLSLVNSVSSLAGSSWGFIAGLGITQVFDALGASTGGVFKGVAAVLDILVAFGFIGIGALAHRRAAGFVVGLSLYALDSLIFLLGPEWIGLAFHVFVLFSVFQGYRAFRELRALGPAPAAAPATGLGDAPPPPSPGADAVAPAPPPIASAPTTPS